MKSISRYLTIIIAAGSLAFSQSLWAGSCCTDTSDNAKKGKACEKCVEHACCKEAVKKAAKEAKACEKCAAKKEEKK